MVTDLPPRPGDAKPTTRPCAWATVTTAPSSSQRCHASSRRARVSDCQWATRTSAEYVSSHDVWWTYAHPAESLNVAARMTKGSPVSVLTAPCCRSRGVSWRRCGVVGCAQSVRCPSPPERPAAKGSCVHCEVVRLSGTRGYDCTTSREARDSTVGASRAGAAGARRAGAAGSAGWRAPGGQRMGWRVCVVWGCARSQVGNDEVTGRAGGFRSPGSSCLVCARSQAVTVHRDVPGRYDGVS